MEISNRYIHINKIHNLVSMNSGWSLNVLKIFFILPSLELKKIHITSICYKKLFICHLDRITKIVDGGRWLEVGI